MLKIGSLFDGSGGFPLAASMCGIEPVWASEIEPYPIAVTRSRFPNMKHLGSVTDIRGDEIEPVDVITFGSPCQDLSVAGKRAGLKHTENGDDETTRSGLFMEAVRIIKEMRKATNGEYPRYAIWENVPGAFSSNKGLDFRVVLEELIRIAEPTAVMPEVPKAGWPYADVYCGDGWSLAYRVLDAQYWGVPQRRRRIYLVADFRGQRAGQVSFEREGLRGYFAESGTSWQGASPDAEGSSGADDRAGVGYDGYNSTLTGDKSATLGVNCGTSTGRNGVVEAIPYTLKIRGGVEVDSAGKAAGKGALIQKNMSATLAAAQDQYLFQPVVAAGFKAGQSMAGGIGWQEECAATLSAQCSGTEPTVCYSIENHPADSRVNIDDSGKVQTLTSRMGTGGGNVPMVMEPVCSSGEVVGTLDASYFKGCGMRQGVEREYVLQPVYCLQGGGATSQNYQGMGYKADSSYTLNTTDMHGVVYAETYQKTTGPLMANSHPGSYSGQDAYNDMFVVAGVDCCNATEYPEKGVVRVRYIVRRLTPTECARLQGFPDYWGHIDEKADFTEEEYAFWLEVRNTHATINGKVVKDYTKAQMLTWYNKLHTDSSEYKLWGNGIALPCALYVMQGIAGNIKEVSV